jgi:hypothetical protein
MDSVVEWLKKVLMTSEKAPNYNQWAFEKAKEMEKEKLERVYQEALREISKKD